MLVQKAVSQDDISEHSQSTDTPVLGITELPGGTQVA